MGYFVKQTDCRFKIANKNVLTALQSLKDLAKDKKEKAERLPISDPRSFMIFVNNRFISYYLKIE